MFNIEPSELDNSYQYMNIDISLENVLRTGASLEIVVLITLRKSLQQTSMLEGLELGQMSAFWV